MPKIDHVLEYVLFIEHNIRGNTLGQISDVTSEANDVSSVVLDPYVAVLANDEVMAHGVSSWHVMELI